MGVERSSPVGARRGYDDEKQCKMKSAKCEMQNASGDAHPEMPAELWKGAEARLFLERGAVGAAARFEVGEQIENFLPGQHVHETRRHGRHLGDFA